MTQHTATAARPASQRRPGVRRRRADWWVPPSLLALAAIPVLGGIGRMLELLGGPGTVSCKRTLASPHTPVALVVHIVAAVVYALLGAFQFSARLRRHKWHRRAGRLLVVKVGDAWGQAEVEDRVKGVQAELGWVLHPDHTGHGYATEAVRELLRICFDDLHLRRVTADCFARNEASWPR